MTSTSTATQRARPHAGPAWMIMALACTSQFMVILDASIVNVALPSIQRQLGFTATGLAWVVNGYLLTFAGFMLLGGRAADLFGHRRMLAAGLFVFSAASLAGGLATAPEVLVAARVAQGMGAAMLAPAPARRLHRGAGAVGHPADAGRSRGRDLVRGAPTIAGCGSRTGGWIGLTAVMRGISVGCRPVTAGGSGGAR